jgi:H+/Cl- antiporter ClcA
MSLVAHRSTKSAYAVAALAGGLLGSAATFVYLNVDPLERMAADADGFPRWSLWQLPFTLPEGLAGGVAGVAFVLCVRSIRSTRVDSHAQSSENAG